MTEQSLKAKLINNINDEIHYNSLAKDMLKDLPDDWNVAEISDANKGAILAIIAAIRRDADDMQNDDMQNGEFADLITTISIFNLGRAYQQVFGGVNT